MVCFLKHNGYRIESLTPATFPDALEVIKTSLFQDEVVSIGTEVNINPKAVEELFELCADAALDGVSLVAVNEKSGDVVAVIFNKIQVKTSDAPEKQFFEIFANERCTHASSRALVQFMADVDGRCNLLEKYEADCSLELMFLATLREHRRKDLGTLLCKQSIELARKMKDTKMKDGITSINVEDLGPEYSHLIKRKPIDRYPKFCHGICTVEGSRKIVRKLNFKVHLTLPLSEFVFNGKTYTERIGDETAFCEIVALCL